MITFKWTEMINKNQSILVAYYSNTGNNRFLAGKIAESLNAEIIEIIPTVRGQVLLMFLSFLGVGINPRIKDLNIEDYSRIILCGPIWSGTLISPLRGFMGKYRSKIQDLIFVTCCGSIDEEKDSRFGYNRIFDKVRKLMGPKVTHCEAFPITLTLPEEERKNNEAILELRLTDENFKGGIKDRFDQFIRNSEVAGKESNKFREFQAIL